MGGPLEAPSASWSGTKTSKHKIMTNLHPSLARAMLTSPTSESMESRPLPEGADLPPGKQLDE